MSEELVDVKEREVAKLEAKNKRKMDMQMNLQLTIPRNPLESLVSSNEI